MLGEGTKTSQTKSDKFEVQIEENLEKFLSRQEEPYRSLKVSRYEGTDTKFYSDIKVTNPANEKNVWIEVKLNKYANLGGPSFKYNDGKWTCTTTKEDNEEHLANFYLEALEKGSQKFIEFCKKYLKKEDVKLPTDLSPELIKAWKDSGSVEDTENDVQFITDKIPLEGFGYKIAEYYKTAKYEPVYYIQVDDELYIVDPNYNPMSLKTKNGGELKPLSEAYRIGRIQFRAKGIDKKLKDGDKYYYSIVCDVKILADDEKEDEPEYICSFKDEEKFPVIEGITVSESYEPPYTMDQIRQKYGEQTFNRLSADPVHKWRADNGIELIHKEPTRDEFERIWKNWQLMPDELKTKSDKKSIELFGITNKENYEKLANQYNMIDESKKLFERCARVILEDWDPTFDNKPQNQFGEDWKQVDYNNAVFQQVNQLVRDCCSDPDEEHLPDRIELSQVHKVKNDYYIATIHGGCNGAQSYRKIIVYLSVVKKLAKKLMDVFGDCWLVDWSNDCLDDVWTVRLGFADVNNVFEKEEFDEIAERLIELENQESTQIGQVDYKTGISDDDVKKILDNVDSSENERYNKSQFEKYLGEKIVDFVGAFSGEDCLALAALQHDYPEKGYHFIQEIQRFKKGFGARLIKDIIADNGKVWLGADPSQKSTLVDFYRRPEFDFGEFVVENSVYGVPLHIFYTKDCDKDTIESFVAGNYKQIDEAEKDIGGEKSDKIPENGIKIWLDDIREAPEGFKWFKSVNDFIDWCHERNDFSDVTLIDTDHDAGDYQSQGGDYVRCFDYLDFCGCENVTVHIHSANPVGANNIRRIISRNKERGWKEIRNS